MASPTSCHIRMLVSWRGQKIDLPLSRGATVGSLKAQIVKSVDKSLLLSAGDIKILHKGRVLANDDAELYDLVVPNGGKKPPKVVRLMATGASEAEIKERDRSFEEGLRAAPRVRDDLTAVGRADLARRREAGQRTLAQAAARSRAAKAPPQYSFGHIETLPNLPDEKKAKEILTSLANDPGILACMAKHRWNVGCLAEMFPEGKVGQDEVCVMGLNQNKGQKILLRLRTDDLKGFRKILSIRKVLFHELAHNVHSDHDGDFFLLMRQIEKECNEMDWTQGSGSTIGGVVSHEGSGVGMAGHSTKFEGGTHRLGGDSDFLSHSLPARDLAARAAIMRLTAEEEEIQQCCGCGSKGVSSDKDTNSRQK
eukprot:CAMPEP_0197439490 /NCGR_PEP_ID=MMETSP1175-20131217/6217_1 /TAXON_ID=1003142 /ORGANISM="Triceratium dubium, Strain CCMP147" /LENGTH=366 /DNA_ID=CAMNT_0042969415 /DNA_START=120 /DNA_END=1220 /DNA_ORIENTATION=+